MPRPALRASLLTLSLSTALSAFAPARAEKPLPVEPDESDPKLPRAGDPIKISVPEKKEGSSLLWKPRWQKFTNAEYVVTGVSIAITVGSLFIPPRPSAWNSGGILFDEGARDVLRPDSPGWRYNMRDTSDVLLSISSTYPFLVDALIVAWWHRGSSTVATQMALMNAEAMAVTAAIQGITSGFGSRERPYGRECAEDSDVEDCRRTNRYRSFFSGHTSQAFVSAALTCAHHDNLRLYGTRAADLAACVSHVALAATIGTLRIVSDMHYASDVLTGAVIGSLVGLTIPYVFHYKPKLEKSDVSLTVVPMPTGIAVTGIFG